MAFRLIIPQILYRDMVAHAVEERPRECCGLLAGRVMDGIGRAERLYRLVNKLASPTRYLTEGRSLLNACRDVRESGLCELAVYHSHPTSSPVPSVHDLAGNAWEDYAMHLIIGLTTDPPEVRGWWLTEETYREAEWEVE